MLPRSLSQSMERESASWAGMPGSPRGRTLLAVAEVFSAEMFIAEVAGADRKSQPESTLGSSPRSSEARLSACSHAISWGDHVASLAREYGALGRSSP